MTLETGAVLVMLSLVSFIVIGRDRRLNRIEQCIATPLAISGCICNRKLGSKLAGIFKNDASR